jgi:hypothetical protein
MRNLEETERFRQSVLMTERRLVRAIGSKEDLELLPDREFDRERGDSA